LLIIWCSIENCLVPCYSSDGYFSGAIRILWFVYSGWTFNMVTVFVVSRWVVMELIVMLVAFLLCFLAGCYLDLAFVDNFVFLCILSFSRLLMAHKHFAK